jgi:hypothetical protein
MAHMFWVAKLSGNAVPTIRVSNEPQNVYDMFTMALYNRGTGSAAAKCASVVTRNATHRTPFDVSLGQTYKFRDRSGYKGGGYSNRLYRVRMKDRIPFVQANDRRSIWQTFAMVHLMLDGARCRGGNHERANCNS